MVSMKTIYLYIETKKGHLEPVKGDSDRLTLYHRNMLRIFYFEYVRVSHSCCFFLLLHMNHVGMTGLCLSTLQMLFILKIKDLFTTAFKFCYVNRDSPPNFFLIGDI